MIAPDDGVPMDNCALHAPILVGYAFGKKKMSTMSLIMAEASQALSSMVLTPAPPAEMAVGAEETETGRPARPDVASSPRRPSLLTSEALLRRTHSSPGSVLDKRAKATVVSLESEVGTSPCCDAAAASVRVSFVPLDLSFPLEEQHGGRFDVILHKLTEDVLLGATGTSDGAVRARTRLARLARYAHAHPRCHLADDPSRVAGVLDRLRIATTLRDCLRGVRTDAGWRVAAPRFAVCRRRADLCAAVAPGAAGALRLPLIAKPLEAAGTAESHRLAIVLGAAVGGGPARADVRYPVLLQEYANHGSVLHKVYVLGDAVFVYARPSLPDIPPWAVTARGGQRRRAAGTGDVVVFDSQRPYPGSLELGLDIDTGGRPAAKRTRVGPPPRVTAEDVRPVVDVLRRAFGLEIFGFDIIVAGAAGGSDHEMLVVDVNYFPSYKEVHNFPAQLAQYLTQKAVDARQRQR